MVSCEMGSGTNELASGGQSEVTLKTGRAQIQPSPPDAYLLQEAVGQLSSAGSSERGAVFTRREVVEFILDLVGYTCDRHLHESTLLEPSFGHGDFLLVAVERLLVAWRLNAATTSVSSLERCICAVELHRDSFHATRTRVVELLRARGIGPIDAERLAGAWLKCDDFLLAELPSGFDHVVGNPPYIRQELIPDALISEYRSRYRTLFDRADIYIPFIERSLGLLAESGVLGFICADRWMKNRYGGPLREMVASDFHLKAYVDMVDTPAFHNEVSAYPAVMVISRSAPGHTRIARRPEIDRSKLSALAGDLLSRDVPDPGGPVTELSSVVCGRKPWVFERSDQLALVRRIERDFPPLEEAGCRVGIGVATGADDAYIGPYKDLDVESDRKLRLVMTRDILTGTVQWRGLGVINPFGKDGKLVDLDRFPRLQRYFEVHRGRLSARHVARRSPARWYRTIDRIYPELAQSEKLLIPDIKGRAHIVHEDGRLYPHHNLYYITSGIWNLRSLRVLLLSGIAHLFVAAYSTRMRGGYLRFQAQYLRRICIPRWEDVPDDVRGALSIAAQTDDAAAAVKAVAKLYGLSEQEQSLLHEQG